MEDFEGVREFHCDVCESTEAIEAPYTRLYTNDEPLYICKSCGFVYVKFRRSSRAIADWWSQKLYGSHYVTRIPAVKARQTYVADFIDQHVPLQGKYVIDIGAGEGQFLSIITREYGANVLAIEPSAENCRKLEALGHPHFLGTVEDFRDSKESKGKKADIVTITWTLENCMSSRDMLDIGYDILSDNGYLVVGTGSRILVPFKKPLHYYIGPDEPQDIHPFRFSARTLQGALAVSGLKPIHINRYLDSDILCVIAQKKPKGTKIEWEKDNYLEVADFFTRWHLDSEHYK